MRTLSVSAIVLLLFIGCAKEQTPQPSAPRPAVFPRLARFEPMKIPTDNPLTARKVALGKKLFFEPRLSADNATSCSGCHDPQYGYTMGAATPVAISGATNRACPSLLNAGYSRGYFWEGAPIPLEKAILGMWQFVMVRPDKDGRPTNEEITSRLNEDAALRAEFVAAFGTGASPDTVAKALASFVRTLVPVDSPWVRFHDGDTTALSEAARRGFEVFDATARCTNCHTGPLLTDRLRHDVGTGKAFKTPTLLNIAHSAPYFHDNRIVKLEEAVDRMLAGGFETKTRDPQLRQVTLNAEERELLLAFLRELDANATQ